MENYRLKVPLVSMVLALCCLGATDQELGRLNHDILTAVTAASLDASAQKDFQQKVVERKALLLSVADNPPVFLRYVFPQPVVEKMPVFVRDDIEKRVNIRGGFMEMVFDDVVHHQARFKYQLISIGVDRHMYQLHFSERPISLRPGSVVDIKGVELDGHIVVDNKDGRGAPS